MRARERRSDQKDRAGEMKVASAAVAVGRAEEIGSGVTGTLRAIELGGVTTIGVMLVFVVCEVLGRPIGFMSAIRCDRRPTDLKRQQCENEDADQTAHFFSISLRTRCSGQYPDRRSGNEIPSLFLVFLLLDLPACVPLLQYIEGGFLQRGRGAGVSPEPTHEYCDAEPDQDEP